MSDAPERIWADDAGGWWRLESDEDPGALIEYTRADLHDALRARIAELEAEAEQRDEQIMGMIEASGQECACGYDRSSDVCLGHMPHFRKSIATARNEALEEAARVVCLHPMEGRNATKVALAVAIRALKDRNETEPEREPDNRTDNPDNSLDGEREET